MKCVRLTAAVAIVALASSVTLLAVDSKKAEYVGGTIQGIQEKSEGQLITNDEAALHFKGDKGGVDIPYAAIESLEYGQKAGRRVGVAIMVSPLALFSKKRKHFLTIGYKDAAGKDQAGVFELGKDIVRTTLTVVETRSGKKIEYQDEEAKKAGRGGN
jgi:hypothetical protein